MLLGILGRKIWGAMETENNRDLCENCSEHYHETSVHGALCLAASVGHSRCVNWFVEAGVDVNRRDGSGTLPLVSAAVEGQEECVKALLEGGADLNIVDRLEGRPSLMFAADRGHTNCVKLLIQAGADVNCRNCSNFTPVTDAASFGAEDTIELLIKSGADVNATDNSGMTAFMKAAEDVNVRGTGCVKLLLRLGALINLFNTSNQNALQNHIRYSSSPFVSLHRSKRYRRNRPISGMCMFLFAAGETIDATTVKATGREFPVPDCLLFKDLKFSLKHLCRMVIRKHLLDLDPHRHLFGRVPRIGLPASLSEYLLFGESLKPDGSIKYECDGNDGEIVYPPLRSQDFRKFLNVPLKSLNISYASCD